MISVRCIGHIGTSVGSAEVEFDEAELEATQIVEKLRSMSGRNDPGFSKFNTLLLIEEGEAFVPASGAQKVKSGQRAVLIPFSHGG